MRSFSVNFFACMIACTSASGSEAGTTGTVETAATGSSASPTAPATSSTSVGTSTGPSSSGPETSLGSDTTSDNQVGVQGLYAVPANRAIGLEWETEPAAATYTVYWSTDPGVSPETGTAIESVTPGYVHRDLENDTVYYYVVTADDGEPSDEVSATPAGEWQLVHFGAGTIEPIDGGAPAWVPIEDRVHVAVLPEGYLAEDLAVFEDDVQAWFDDVFATAPYADYPAAFVVWSLPRASAEHVSATTPQAADTAFEVPITADGVSVASSVGDGPTAALVWQELGSFAFPPSRFWPAGGVTSEIATNFVGHMLVFDPADGDSGFSGRSRRLENPRNPDERIAVAFARNVVHEFTHAFARLEDEYLDVDQSDLGQDNALTDQSAYVSNVVVGATCDTLPWQHLLGQGGDLVGAFGTAQHGYHPEFKCLMNGTHDNADYYGGDGDLRSDDRLCNWCRELTTFRIFERIAILDDPATSLATWSADFRDPYYERYEFFVPATVPQENSAGTPWFEPCGG